MLEFTLPEVLIGATGGMFAIRFRDSKVSLMTFMYLVFSGVVGATIIAGAGCEYLFLSAKKCAFLQVATASITDSIMRAVTYIGDTLKNNADKISRQILNIIIKNFNGKPIEDKESDNKS